MSGFFDALVAAATADGPVDADTASSAPVDRPAVRTGAVLASVAVVAELARLGAGGGRWTWQRLLRPGTAAAGEPDSTEPGQSLTRMLFGDRAEPVVEVIARDAPLSPADAELVLRTATQAAASLLVARVGRGDQPDFRAEADALAANGWGAWLAALALTVTPPVPEPEPVVAADDAPEPATEAESPLTALEPKVAGIGEAKAPPWPPATVELAVPPDEQGPVADERPSRRLMVAGAVTVVAAALGALAVSTRFGGDDIDSGQATTTSTAGASATDDTADLAAVITGPVVAPAGAAVTTAVAGPATAGADPEAPVGPTTFRLALADPQGASDAAGTAQLDLDPATGEICYRFEVAGLTDPFPGHIHAAPTGASGGITVDFGYLTGVTPSGCIDSFPADVADMIRHPERRYVELHDTARGFGIRSRLAEAPPSAASPGPTTGPGADTAAVTVLSGGRVVLRGEVPDDAARSSLMADTADLAGEGLAVVDELTVRAGAPVPSNRVVVEEPLLFPFDSNRLADDAARSVDQLARILQLRPQWRVTLVGNTDGVGDVVYNLTLSLRRAIAARNALVEAGVPPETVTIRGDGPFAPVADNDTPDGRTRNRRIDVVIATTP